jgi:Lrp/AsnC family transcriptional regulator, regulator for asnA, asnC and gidA
MVDQIDLQIIAELTDDARKPFRQIAEKIGVSTQTIIKRYNEMKKSGLIQHCSISVNLKKIGYSGSAHLLITGSTGSNLSETMSKLRKTPNIIIATKTIGDFEGYAVLVFKDATDLYENILQLKKILDVENLKVSISVPGIKDFPRTRCIIP